MADHVSVRLSPSQTARLGELARRAGVSRSRVLRRVIDAAAGGIGVPAVRLSKDEGLDLLHEQARAGRTSAIVQILRRAAQEDPRGRALLAFEQLAAERRR